jgi:hypothetical protein
MQLVFRANLGATAFPFLSSNSGRGIVLRQFDQNFIDNITSREDLDRDVGVPQAYYLENVLPAEQGLISVGYTRKVAPLNTTESLFKKRFSIRNESGARALLGLTSDGRLFSATFPLFTWVEVALPVTLDTKELYVANVGGITYIYIEKTGCYIYDIATNILASVTLTGLTESEIIGVCGAKGYLIAWSASEVAWSSTIDPTDFVPSLTTNAGGGGVEGKLGEITFCAPHNLGFIVYTTANAVAAEYSGNPRFPFNFNAISGSGGCLNQDFLASDATEGNHWIYGTSGLQIVNTKVANVQFPAITDFVSNRTIEYYDKITKVITRKTITAPMVRKINLINNRYLVVSYGETELTHAIVYDTALKRFGKLASPHVDCFTWDYEEDRDNAKESIGLLKKDGSVLVANTSWPPPVFCIRVAFCAFTVLLYVR